MWRKLVGVLLVLVMLGIVAGTAMASTPYMVDQSEAKAVVNKFIAKISTTDEFRDWKDAKISRVIVAYDIDESPSAYVFELFKDGKYAGYVVVSAKKTNYPILEFSKGKSPLMRAKKLGIKVEKVYYLGALTYFFKEKGKYYDLNKKEINFNKIKESVKEVMKDEKIIEHLAKRIVEAKEQWKKYNSDTMTTLGWLYKEKYIPNVPALWWDDGCAPTSAAMVLEYWGEHGYQNLNYPDWWYFEPTDVNGGTKFDDPSNEHTDLTEELHYAMGTDNETGSTWLWNIAPGINKVCKNHGYSNWASTDYWVSWSDVTDEINASRPFVLAMLWGGTGSGHNQPYGNHAVAGVGYAIDTNTNEKFVMVQDTWDLSIHYLAFGNWMGAWEIKVKPN